MNEKSLNESKNCEPRIEWNYELTRVVFNDYCNALFSSLPSQQTPPTPKLFQIGIDKVRVNAFVNSGSHDSLLPTVKARRSDSDPHCHV